MKFFDILAVKHVKTGISIRYNRRTLLLIYPDVLIKLIAENFSNGFLTKLFDSVEIKPIDDEVIRKAKQLERCYTNRRKKYFRNKNLKTIDKKSKDFNNFVKAIDIIERHKTNYRTLITAQVEGLKFVDNGRGSFPLPSQIANNNAETRLIEYLKKEDDANSLSDFIRLEISHFDKTTPLSDNPSYQRRYEEMKNGKASLQSAYFVYDCQWARKNGKPTKYVERYIDEMEN